MSQSPAPASPIRLLAVVNDQDYRNYLEIAVPRLGHTVSTFDDASSALQALAHTPDAWDAAMVSLHLQGLGGFSFVEAARECRPGLPCAVVTVMKPEELRLLDPDVPVAKVQQKPQRLDQLAVLIEGLSANR